MTQSEKKALLVHFIVLQETGKYENTDHMQKGWSDVEGSNKYNISHFI